MVPPESHCLLSGIRNRSHHFLEISLMGMTERKNDAIGGILEQDVKDRLHLHSYATTSHWACREVQMKLNEVLSKAVPRHILSCTRMNEAADMSP